MMHIVQKTARSSATTISAVALALLVVSVSPSDTRTGEAEAKSLLKAMSDYLAAHRNQGACPCQRREVEGATNRNHVETVDEFAYDRTFRSPLLEAGPRPWARGVASTATVVVMIGTSRQRQLWRLLWSTETTCTCNGRNARLS